MGREFRLSIIEGLVDVGEDTVLDAMDEALTASIVTEEPGVPGNFSFTHTLIREALYTSITAARRVRLHHRIASALEQQSSPFESRVGRTRVPLWTGVRIQERREGCRLRLASRRSRGRDSGVRERGALVRDGAAGHGFRRAEHGCHRNTIRTARQTRKKLLRRRSSGHRRRTPSKPRRVCSIQATGRSGANCWSASPKQRSG